MIPQEGLQMQIEIYRRMTGQQRLQIAFELSDLTREIVPPHVRSYHADWTDEQVEREVIRRFLLAAGILERRDWLAESHQPGGPSPSRQLPAVRA